MPETEIVENARATAAAVRAQVHEGLKQSGREAEINIHLNRAAADLEDEAELLGDPARVAERVEALKREAELLENPAHVAERVERIGAQLAQYADPAARAMQRQVLSRAGALLRDEVSGGNAG